MKKKSLFYSLFALTFLGSIGLTQIESSKIADIATATSLDSGKEGPGEEREEEYEAEEAQAEVNEPSIIALQ